MKTKTTYKDNLQRFLGSIILCIFFMGASSITFSQTVTGGCSEVIVSEIPPYPTVYFSYVGFMNSKRIVGYYDGCAGDGLNSCCRIITSGNPVTPRFWLEQLQTDGSWLEVAGPQYVTTFNNVNNGTYRVKCQRPNIHESACGNDRLGNPVRVRMCLFDLNGQFIGYWGTWDNAYFGNLYPITYSNTVLVGPTTKSDISYTFIDIPETGAEGAYDYGETVIIDVSECKNYNQWWLAIFEDGPNYNRYKSNGWSNGTIPGGKINLSEFWDSWKFETFHQYTVQLAIENRQCRNGIEYPNPNGWNNLDRTFFICPEGSGCRFGIDEREIVISPNPANSIIQLQNFEPGLDRNYVMTITDISGRQVKNIPLTADRVDVSDLQPGIFIVNIFKKGQRVFNSKLVVNQ